VAHQLAQRDPHNPIAIANNVYELINTGELFNYLHKAMLSPTKAALIKAVKQGHLTTWTGLTEDTINNHLKVTPATAMGHMNQRRQTIRSTSKEAKFTSDLEDATLTPAGNGGKTHLVYAVVIDQGQLYTDLTRRFLQRSSKGNWYVMVVYLFDCNYIKPVAMKSKSASEWLKAFGGIFQELTSLVFKPKLQTMENEAFVPPQCHM
jgi:hypothetical protein